MSISSGRSQLSNAFKSLKQEWEATEIVWRDEVREDFADDHWSLLASRISSVLTAMDRLDQAMAQMKQDCGSERN